jgi:hypothetical protein
MSNTTSTTDPKARAAITAGLRALADYLDTHPGLPVPQFSMCAGLTVYPGGSEEDKRAEVDRIAEVLQVVTEEFGGLPGGTAVRRSGRLSRGGGSQRSRRRERHRGAVRP